MNIRLLFSAIVLVAAACSAPGTTKTCGDGTTDKDGTCVAVTSDAGPSLTCGTGTVLVGGQCVAVDGGPDIQCGSGTVLANGECVSVDAGPSATVVIEIVGLGHGTVSGSGVSCTNNVCSVTALQGTVVALTATPDTGYFFAGWKGVDCALTGSCNVTVNGYKSIKAGFSAALYWSNNDAFIAPLDGSASITITGLNNPLVAPRYNFASTPDGMTLAFSSGQFGNSVWVADYWSGIASPVTENPGWGFGVGGLSPDGSKVAFVQTNANPYNVVIADIDGTKTTVTDFSAYVVSLDDCHNNYGCATARYVTWSPDGAHIAWVDRSALEADGAATVYDNIWIADADGSNARRLTNFNDTTVTADPNAMLPDWSADSTKVAFFSSLEPGNDRTGGTGTSVGNLWTVDIASKALFCVTNFTAEYYIDMPTWARTGHGMIFSSKHDPVIANTAPVSARNLFSIKDDGTGLTAVTSSTGANTYSQGPYWAPDRTTIIYESNVDPNDATATTHSHIWAVVPGSAPKQLTSTDSWDYTPIDNND